MALPFAGTDRLDTVFPRLQPNLWSASHLVRLYTLRSLAAFTQHTLTPPEHATPVCSYAYASLYLFSIDLYTY